MKWERERKRDRMRDKEMECEWGNREVNGGQTTKKNILNTERMYCYMYYMYATNYGILCTRSESTFNALQNILSWNVFLFNFICFHWTRYIHPLMVSWWYWLNTGQCVCVCRECWSSIESSFVFDVVDSYMYCVYLLNVFRHLIMKLCAINQTISKMCPRILRIQQQQHQQQSANEAKALNFVHVHVCVCMCILIKIQLDSTPKRQ